MLNCIILNSNNNKNRLFMGISQLLALYTSQLCTNIKKNMKKGKDFSPQDNAAIWVNNGQVQRISFRGV